MDGWDEEIRCAKCWSFMDKTDNFCRKCGAKQSGGDSDAKEFDPSENEMQEIYGPPEAFERRARDRSSPEDDGWIFVPPAFDPEQNIMAPIYGPPPFLGDSDEDEWA